MSDINPGRVVAGGLAAGVVMNVVDMLTNGVWLNAQWMDESKLLNIAVTPSSQTTAMTGWVTVDFLMGIALVWLYAAIRPRFGPGPGTAIKAALAVFVVSHLVVASWWFNGLYSADLVMRCSLGGLVSALAGGLVGGLIYKE